MSNKPFQLELNLIDFLNKDIEYIPIEKISFENMGEHKAQFLLTQCINLIEKQQKLIEALYNDE